MTSIAVSINFCGKVCVQIPSSSCNTVSYTFVNSSPSLLNLISGTNGFIITAIYGTTGLGIILILEAGQIVSSVYVTVTGFSSTIDIFEYCGLSTMGTGTGNVTISGLEIVPEINDPNNIFFVSLLEDIIPTTAIIEYYFVPGTNPTIQLYTNEMGNYIPQVLILNNYPSSNYFNSFPICGSFPLLSTIGITQNIYMLSNLQCQLSNYLSYVQSSNGFVYSSSTVGSDGLLTQIGGYSGEVTLSYFIAINNYSNPSATSGLYFTSTSIATSGSTSSSINLESFPGISTYDYIWFVQFMESSSVYVTNLALSLGKFLVVNFSGTLSSPTTLALFAFVPSADTPFISTPF